MPRVPRPNPAARRVTETYEALITGGVEAGKPIGSGCVSFMMGTPWANSDIGWFTGIGVELISDSSSGLDTVWSFFCGAIVSGAVNRQTLSKDQPSIVALTGELGRPWVHEDEPHQFISHRFEDDASIRWRSDSGIFRSDGAGHRKVQTKKIYVPVGAKWKGVAGLGSPHVCLMLHGIQSIQGGAKLSSQGLRVIITMYYRE